MTPERICRLAAEAGEAIMAVYASGDAGERRKQDDSPLTAADLASEAVIQAGLRAIDPDLQILSEEAAQADASVRRAWSRCWIVDPLDGTKEFISRNGEFTVNIALAEAGVPRFGVVLAPAIGRCWWGGPAWGGAWRDGVAVRCAQRQDGRPWRVVASRSHAGPDTETWLSALGAHERVAMGSSLKICAVADGSADLYPRLGPTMEWDTAAAHAVLAGAGGRMVAADGRDLAYNKPDLHNPWFLASAGGMAGLPPFPPTTAPA